MKYHNERCERCGRNKPCFRFGEEEALMCEYCHSTMTTIFFKDLIDRRRRELAAQREDSQK